MMRIETETDGSKWVHFIGRISINVKKDGIFFCINNTEECSETPECLKDLSHAFYKKGDKWLGQLHYTDKLLKVLESQ